MVRVRAHIMAPKEKYSIFYDEETDTFSVVIDRLENTYEDHATESLLLMRGEHSHFIREFKIYNFSRLASTAQALKMAVGFLFLEQEIMEALPPLHRRGKTLKHLIKKLKSQLRRKSYLWRRDDYEGK